MGLGTDFFNWLQYWLLEVFDTMSSTYIFDAYGYTISLWDLYATSSKLIAFFDCVITPLLQHYGIIGVDEDSIEDIGEYGDDDQHLC